MAAPSFFVRDSVVRHSTAFTTSAGAAADPTGVTFKYIVPGTTTVTTLTYGTDISLVKDSVGNYHVDLTVSTSGVYKWKWTGTGTNASSSEDVTRVRDSSF